MKRIYFDYAASTPVDPRVEAAMKPYFGKIYGNPHALHRFGQEASRAVFEARRKIADSIGADYKEIVFTGSATEANNLAIRGVVKKFQSISTNFHQFLRNPRETSRDLPYGRKLVEIYRPRIIISSIEHESVLETCRDLEREGVEVIYIPVSREGLVDLKKLKSAFNERTLLVSIMHANNEIGTVQPIVEIARMIRDFRVQNVGNVRDVGNVGSEGLKQAKRSNKRSGSTPDIQLPTPYPLLHTDAVQSFQYLDCNVDRLGVDLMTISAHKIYGPKGIGVLYIKNQKPKTKNQKPSSDFIVPIITGSGQEWGLRSGTDNVPSVVGFAKAVEIADKMRKKEAIRVGKLRDYFCSKLKKIKVIPRLSSGNKAINSGNKKSLVLEPVEGLQLNGSMKNRLPNNLNIYFPGHTAQGLLIKLDMAGIAASPGAACSSRVSKISYVLEALGFPEERAGGSLRFSLGRQTTKGDIGYAIDKIRKSVL